MHTPRPALPCHSRPVQLKNRIHQLAGLAAMGKTVGLELLVGRLWRAPFHLFCAPGAPAVQLAHFAE